jgi:hypothetical protein
MRTLHLERYNSNGFLEHNALVQTADDVLGAIGRQTATICLFEPDNEAQAAQWAVDYLSYENRIAIGVEQ